MEDNLFTSPKGDIDPKKTAKKGRKANHELRLSAIVVTKAEATNIRFLLTLVTLVHFSSL